MGEITLEKNKDYIEFLMHTMMVTHRPYEDDAEISITGMIPERNYFAANNPFDISCDVVMVSKRAFERLLADDQHYREMTKQLNEANEALLKRVRRYHELIKECEKNYKTLSNLVGFSSVEEIEDYLTNEAECDTLHEAISNLHDDVEVAKEYIIAGLNAVSIRFTTFLLIGDEV